jgi:hypothetical protein
MRSKLLAAFAATLLVAACSGKRDAARPLAVRIVSPAATTYVNGDLWFEVEADGAYEGVDLALDGAVIAELVPPERFLWKAANVAEGSYRFVARARRGTEQVLSAPVTVTVDRVKPQVASASPAADAIVYAPFPAVEVTFDEPIRTPLPAGAVSARWRDGGLSATAAVVGTSTIRITLPAWLEGAEVTVAGVTDLAGNLADPFTRAFDVLTIPVVAGPRELGAGTRLTSVRVAAAPSGGTVVAAVAGSTPRVWRVSPDGVVTALPALEFITARTLDVAVRADGTPLLVVGGVGSVGVFGWTGSGWESLGAPAEASGALQPHLVIDPVGAPIVAWIVPVPHGESPARLEARVARLAAGSWTPLAGFHPAGQHAFGTASVATLDGVAYVACWEGPVVPDGTGGSVVVRSWDGTAWQPAFDTGVKGDPDLRTSVDGRAALAVTLAPELGTLAGAVRVFSRPATGAWGEVAALARAVDTAVYDAGYLESTVGAVPGPVDAAVARIASGRMVVDFRRPGDTFWSVWGPPFVPGSHQAWPAVDGSADGTYRFARVERAGADDYLVVSSLRFVAP